MWLLTTPGMGSPEGDELEDRMRERRALGDKTQRLQTPECVFVVTLPTADTEVFNKQLLHLTAQAAQPNVCRATDRCSLISSASWLMMYTLPCALIFQE